MAKILEIGYKGYPIYKGTIVEGEFYYKAPPSISEDEWFSAICDLMSRFDKFLIENGRDPAPTPPSSIPAYAHAKF